MGATEIGLAPHEPLTVSGSLALESGDPKELTQLVLSLITPATGRAINRAVGANGEFSFPNVPPSLYRINLGNTLGYFASQVKANGPEWQNGLLTISDSPVSLTVTASKGVGRITGLVYQAAKPRAGILVVLIATTGPPSVSRGFQTDSDGSFDINNVIPGEYALVTVQDAEFEFANPAITKPFLETSKKIRIDPNSTYTEKIEIE